MMRFEEKYVVISCYKVIFLEVYSLVDIGFSFPGVFTGDTITYKSTPGDSTAHLSGPSSGLTQGV